MKKNAQSSSFISSRPICHRIASPRVSSRRLSSSRTCFSPKFTMHGVSRLDSSFNTTSIPFLRAKATTLFADPKSNPTTLIERHTRRRLTTTTADPIEGRPRGGGVEGWGGSSKGGDSPLDDRVSGVSLDHRAVKVKEQKGRVCCVCVCVMYALCMRYVCLCVCVMYVRSSY